MDLVPLFLSVKLALFTTLVLLVISIPLAALMAFGKGRWIAHLEAITSLPLVLPPTALGFYLLIFMGPQGLLGRMWTALTGGPLTFTFYGILLASMIYSLPFAVQPLKTAFEKFDKRLIESAYMLGCSPVETFFRVVLPNSMNGILASSILTFAHTTGEFGVVLMVGGSIPGKTKVASIAIYEYVEALQYKKAAIISLIMVVGSYLVLLAVNRLNRRGLCA